MTTAYDGFGRVTSSTLAMGGTSRSIGHLYDANGNRVRITHPDAYFTYEYDGLGRFRRAYENGGDPVAGTDYDAAGRPASSGWSAPTAYGYDPVGRPQSLSHNFAGTSADQVIGLAYNPAGQIMTRSGSNDSYAWTGSVAVNRPYSVNGQNQYTAAGSATFAYDASGNLTSDGSTTFVYDVENRLVSASGAKNAALGYDPAGRLAGLGRELAGAGEFAHSYNVFAEYCGAPLSLVGVAGRPNLGSGGNLDMRKFSLAVAAALLLGSAAAPALAQGGHNGHSGHKAAAAGKARYGDFGLDLTAMDRSVKPGDSFWHFVNGNWDKTTQIAADRTSAGPGVLLAEEAEAQVRAIVEDLARDPSKSGKIGQQVGDFYATWMDEAAIEAAGTAPLKPHLARISAISNKADLLRAFAEPGIMSPLGVGILPDPADPTRYIAATGQGGLGLPNRDYYLLQGEKYDTIRKAYRAYVVKMQQLAGIADAEAKADRIIALETALAKIHWEPARQRDIKQIYNPMNRAQLAQLAPQVDWPLFLEAAGLASVPTVIAAEKSAITETARTLETVPLSTWKDYLAFHFVSSHANALPKAFDQANFDFYSKTLRGVPQQRERWKRGVQMINGSLGEAVGRVYVERHYPAESNRQMSELIANLRSGLEERLAASPWMDSATKEQARAKLAAFDPRIGHPTKWIDYSSFEVKRGDLLGNVVRAQKFGHELQLSRLGKPVDRDLWDMNPQEVNAYYNPLMNQITFPAAILQPPYFDPKADPAINYGSIGAIIGHEIGHGFDDQGRQFDATGRIRDWWSASSGTEFTKRAEKLGKQFDQYEPLPGTKINGKLTMGENIGDLGGLEMAYAAYRRYVAKHGEPKVMNGLTGDQRFFIAYGQSWRSKAREGAMRERLLTDPHSPPEYRVNGIVRNVDAWYKAFNVKPGDKMYLPPEQRVSIW